MSIRWRATSVSTRSAKIRAGQTGRRGLGGGGFTGGSLPRAVQLPRVRPLLHILHTTTTAFSVVLFGATLVLWACTQRHYPIVSYATQNWCVALLVDTGSLQLSWARYAGPTRWTGWGYCYFAGDGQIDYPPSHFGHRHVSISRVTADEWSCPYWFVLVLASAVPAGSAIGHLIRRRRRHQGRCQQCRYDLTGNASGVCPECGTPITQSADVAR